MTQNVFGHLMPGQSQPQDPVIARDPYKQNAEARAQEAAERADRADQRAERADQRAADAKANPKPTETQGKAAAFLIRALGSNDAYEGTKKGARNIFAQTLQDRFPNLSNELINDPARQVANSAQDEFIAASLRQDSGAAIPEEEMERQRRIYFPMPNDGPEAIEQKRQARLRAIEGLRVNAGPLLDEAEARYSALVESAAQEPSETDDKSGGLVGPVSDDTPSPYGRGATFDKGFFDESGNPLPDNFEGLAFDKDGNQLGLVGSVSDDSPGTSQNSQAGLPGFNTLGAQGITLGLSDEAAGIGGAISNLILGKDVREGYISARDMEMNKIDQARKAWGPVGTAIEVLGGGGAAKIGSGALSVGQAMRQGAAVGGVGGYGYGRDLEGSAVNALAGTALGASAGGALQMGANALARMPVNKTAPDLAQRARDLSRAGQAEGVSVNRAMVDPGAANRITKTDATLVGGKRIQNEMSQIEGQIESRAKALGRGGETMDNFAGGETVKNAGERFIEKSGKAAKAKYDRAERLAGDAKVQPRESLTRTDEMLATLKETPGTNSNEIAFLETLKGDLSKDLSVGALRRMRTSLRKKISKGDLVFGEDEARVLSIMDAAADDIRAGLTAQGKQGAAKAFDSADKAYRARMDYIQNTVQRLIGKRNANIPSERIFTRFQSMANNKGDAAGLKRFYASLDDAERADVAATFAEQLGKNNAGEFSVSHFLSQTEKMSDGAISTVFGKDGAQSIRNLRELGAEVKRVTSAMNSRTSKSGVASYRDWLYSLVAGPLVGIGSGNIATGAAAAGAAAVAKGAKDIISARALMSPNITKWLKQTPRTTNPQVINRHFERLGDIAKMEPAIAGEIETLRKAILGAANDNPSSRLVASDEDAEK